MDSTPPAEQGYESHLTLVNVVSVPICQFALKETLKETLKLKIGVTQVYVFVNLCLMMGVPS